MSLDRHIVESLRRTVAALREIEELVDQLSPDLDAGDALGEAADSIEELVSPDAVAWREFIDEHPELTEPTRLEVTDEKVHDALVEIHAQEWFERRESIHSAPLERRRDFNFPSASGVWRLLMERQELLVSGRSQEFEHSDLMRVVAALKRLERSGRVVQEPCYVYGQRRSSDWHPAGDENHA